MNYKPITKRGAIRLLCILAPITILFYPYLETEVKSIYNYYRYNYPPVYDELVGSSTEFQHDGYTKSGIPKYNLVFHKSVDDVDAELIQDLIYEEYNKLIELNPEQFEYHFAYRMFYWANAENYEYNPYLWNYDCTRHYGYRIQVRPPYIPWWVTRHTLLANVIHDWSDNCE